MRRPGSTTCRKRTGLDRRRSSWILALNLFTYRIWLWLHMSSHLNWLSYLTCAKFGIAVLVTQWIMVVTSLDSKFFTDRSQPLDWQEPLSSGWLRMAFEFWICGAWIYPLRTELSKHCSKDRMQKGPISLQQISSGEDWKTHFEMFLKFDLFPSFNAGCLICLSLGGAAFICC